MTREFLFPGTSKGVKERATILMEVETMNSATPNADANDDFLSDAAFRRRYPVWWWATLLGPFVFVLAILIVVGLSAGSATVGRLIATAAVTFLVGRFVIFGGAVAEQAGFFSTEQLFFLAILMDLLPSLLICFHLDLIFDVPRLGPWLKRIVAESRQMMQANPWLSKAAFLSVTVFVFLPVAGTGTMVASIFGRVLGLTRAIAFAAVAIGSVSASAVIYFLAEFARTRVDLSNPWVTAAMIALQLLLIGIVTYLFQRLKRK